MGQNSNSSSSGFGSLLVRGFIGIVSITATAVISTVVQRYLTPSAPLTPAVTSTTASPIGVPNIAPNSAASPDAFSPNAGSGDRPVDPTQPIDASIQVETQPVVDQTQNEQNSIGQTPVEPTTEAQAQPTTNQPITEQPVTGQPAGQPNDGSSLRERLDQALRDKWNKN